MEKPRMNRAPVVLAVVIMAAVFGLGLATCAHAAPQTDREAMRLINRINRDANIAIPYGTPWPADTADGVWDCENYAELKAARLAQAQYPHPVGGYRVITSWGVHHAVLEVTLPSGRAVVLDNLTPWALPRAQTLHTGWAPISLRPQEP